MSRCGVSSRRLDCLLACINDLSTPGVSRVRSMGQGGVPVRKPFSILDFVEKGGLLTIGHFVSTVRYSNQLSYGLK